MKLFFFFALAVAVASSNSVRFSDKNPVDFWCQGECKILTHGFAKKNNIKRCQKVTCSFG